MTGHLPRIASLGLAAIMFATLILAGCRTAATHDDEALGDRVQHTLNAQPVYQYPDVKVTTFNGVVQLSGYVASDAQRKAATEIVERVRGVSGVENGIVVAPERTLVREPIPGGSTVTTTGNPTNSNTSTNILR